jgi:hypothetical protein
MKVKHTIFLIVIGYCIKLFGALQKILHSPSADNILTIATSITILGFILLLYKLFTTDKFKDFMNQ